jgi:glutamate-5-semialdehyde dehydrogenase
MTEANGPSAALLETGMTARKAARALAVAPTAEKNRALLAIADELEAQASAVLAENARDVEDARNRGLDNTLIDRLLLDPERLAALASDTRRVADLPDPVGTDIDSRVLPNGIHLYRRRIPIGVIGVIYEARPNVTIDIATLCLKTGNASILRGGTETLRTNTKLVQVIRAALDRAGLPAGAVQYIENPDRCLVGQLLRLDTCVDMIIPRGGQGLHRLCREQSTIPVITGGIGICHLFVDESADLDRAVDIIENAKVQRPSVCNALDTMLVHRAVADRFLPAVGRRLKDRGVALRADPDALSLLRAADIEAEPAGAGDFDREWLSLVLGVKVVASVEEAITHIQEHSTEHSDGILTRDQARADRFVAAVNSAAVYVNASTRFTDGGQFGLGAEVAVSTQKLHARGPMGLEELTTYKWIGIGSGQVRE